MSIIKLKAPKLSAKIEEISIVKWFFRDGDIVQKDDILVEIEASKVITTIKSPTTAILKCILAEEGDIVNSGEVIAELDEDVNNELKKTMMEIKSDKKQIYTNIKKNNEICDKIKASHFVKKIAREKGINLTLIKGSGPNGRVVLRDLESQIQDRERNIEEKVKKEIYGGIRKKIGEKLVSSKLIAPHFYSTISINMLKVEELLEIFYKSNNIKISINDFIVFTLAKVLSKHQNLNCTLLNDEIIYHKKVNIGVAVALEEGLVVVVLRSANEKTLIQLSQELNSLIKMAREKKLKPENYQCSTFTISNLGMFGVEQFTSIINPPEVGILAIGKIIKSPFVIEEREKGDLIKILPIMKATLSADHRLVDGVMAAKFLKSLKEALEHPEYLILY